MLPTNHPSVAMMERVAKQVRDETGGSVEFSRAILPWLVPLLIVLVAITVWRPQTLWLPGLVMNK